MPLKLYKMDPSPPARAAMMVTALISAPVEMVNVDLRGKREHMEPEYLKKNPLHTVPVLEDDDLLITDSHAILAYLVDVYGTDDSLYPKDPKQRALVNQKLFFDTGVLFPRGRSNKYLRQNFNLIQFGVIYEGQTKASEKQIADIKQAYDFLEEFLKRTKYLAGDHMTIADISAVTSATFLGHMVPIEPKKYPKILTWLSEMEKKPFYQKYGAPGDAILGQVLREKLQS